MISTCVHCKKQFEWDHTGYKLALVNCCMCGKTDAYNVTRITPLASKPLQVAKKWVVKGIIRGVGEVFLTGKLEMGTESEAFKFGDRVSAIEGLRAFLLKFPDINKPKNLEFTEVPA